VYLAEENLKQGKSNTTVIDCGSLQIKWQKIWNQIAIAIIIIIIIIIIIMFSLCIAIQT
jgi:hypothetical protein